MSQKFSMYEYLKVWENNPAFVRQYMAYLEKEIAPRTDAMCEKSLAFEKERDAFVKDLPPWMEAEHSFSVAIISMSHLLVLDEPTGRFHDPATRRSVSGN
jgi:ABC-2 type transport system ATP-binding protein